MVEDQRLKEEVEVVLDERPFIMYCGDCGLPFEAVWEFDNPLCMSCWIERKRDEDIGD